MRAKETGMIEIREYWTRKEVARLSTIPCTVSNHNEALRRTMQERDDAEDEIRALRAERDRLATDLGVRASLLEQVADGLVAPTREAIQQRHDEMYAELRKK